MSTPDAPPTLTRPLRVVALVKQIPAFEAMGMGEDGRLQRQGLPLEMSAYCRRAVAQGVALAQASGGTCTVLSMGPPSAIDVLFEAVAFGADDGVLLTDPAFAGSDTLATARALAAAIERLGAVDVVLVGRASVDADTGQVGPQVAELLGLAFASPVRRLDPVLVEGHDGIGEALEVGLEQDDLWVDARVALPAVLACAERLIDPCKLKDPDLWKEVPAEAIQVWSASQLGPGPWGERGSATRVGERRDVVSSRRAHRCTGSPQDQAVEAVALLDELGVLDGLVGAGDRARPGTEQPTVAAPTAASAGVDGCVAVLVEPGRARVARELLGGAAALAARRGTSVVAIGPAPMVAEPDELWLWGADAVREVEATTGDDLAAEDVARAVTSWVRHARPWAVLAPGTPWGREVASRVAAALGAGLTGDAVDLEIDDATDTLVAWKPAFGGALVVAVTATTPVQLVTVRPGVLALARPRDRASDAPPVPVDRSSLAPRRRVVVLARRVVDDLDALSVADAVVGVGQGVDPGDYRLLDPLRSVLHAELAATRKVTDRGWLPQSRQVGITGLSLAPRLYVAIATSGKFNHLVGVRGAGTIVAIDRNDDAPVFDGADIGLVGDWRELVPALATELDRALSQRR